MKGSTRFVELGAGTGEAGFAAARRIGDSGRLISTDLPPGMVEVAKRRAKELGVGNAEFRVMDAEHIDLEAGSVDGILCRWAFMLMPDPGSAMAESRRVLRPGGRLSLAVMGGPAQNPWASTVAKSIVGLGLIPPIDPKRAGGVFSLADPDDLRERLRGAGFDDVRIEEVEFHLRFSDFEDFWSFVREFAGAVAILDLPGLSVNALAS